MDSICGDVKGRLVDLGGRTTQDLGLGRIVGQIGAYLYLSDGECSLDEISSELGLSKASVSIASRQLESLGVLQQSWKKGDRKNYYRIAEHLAVALQDGLMSMLRGKLKSLNTELTYAQELLGNGPDSKTGHEIKYIRKRVSRAKKACDTVERVLDNPIVKFMRKKMK